MPTGTQFDKRPFYPTDRVGVTDPETGRVIQKGTIQGANERVAIVELDAGGLMRVSTGFLKHLADDPNERH